MQFVTIKGTKVPSLGFGTWQLTGAQCEAAVLYALELGYRHIDTAQMYGNEDAVGRAIARSGVARGEIFLTTKLGLDNLSASAVRSSLEASLRALATDRVDLLLIHWPSTTVSLGETLRAMNDTRARGLVRHVGVSNFPVKLMREAIETHRADLFCNQIEYHPFLDQSAVFAYARSHGVMLTAYCPLARGKVTSAPALTAIGRRHDKTPAQVALRWLIQQDDVSAIPKSSSRERIAANFAIFDFVLSHTEMTEIGHLRGATRLVDPSFAPRWDPAG